MVVDPLYFVFWPGALAAGAVIALPITMGLQALNRRMGKRRNRQWQCGRCRKTLAGDDIAHTVFVAHGVYVCSNCAQIYRRRYRLALIVVPIVAVVAGVTSLIGVLAGGAPVSFYVGWRLIPVLLPSLGVGVAFLWRIRAAKTANVRRLERGLDNGAVGVSVPAAETERNTTAGR